MFSLIAPMPSPDHTDVSERPVTDTAAAPSGDALETALLLSQTLGELAAIGPHLRERIEDVTGLRSGELRVLRAIVEDDGVPAVDDVARVLGEHPDAVAVTVASLRERGMITPPPDTGGASTEGLEVAERGRVRLDQLAALEVRMLASIPSTVTSPMLTAARALVPGGTDARPAGPSGTPEV